MKIGDRVQTPDGVGTIRAIEPFKRVERFGVVHDTYLRHFQGIHIVYYFKRELELIK